jgi:hypothetical protein
MTFGLIFGAIAVVLSILLTRFQSARLRPTDPVRIEILSWAIYLGMAALIYVGFALREGGREWMGTEIAGLVLYSVFALAGALGRARVLALGWALHAAWDLGVHAGAPEQLVPEWYRWACLVFDVVAAGYVFRLRRPAPLPTDTVARSP